MDNLNIVLTIDYEIFGNGSGDVRWCLINPTKKILKIAEKYNVPITLMVDICEYWAFEKEERKNSLPKGYRPAKWIKEQLVRCIKNKHDIQLHLHPQWINYSYSPDKNKWNVDFSYWRVPSLSYETICKVLKRGKQGLESLLKPFDPQYECNVFRAGAWSIQPEKNILKALMSSGFKVDTSVVPGLYCKNKQNYFNFKEINRKPFWYVKENIGVEETTGILEMPVYTSKYSLYEKIFFKYKKNKIINRPLNCKGYAEYLSKNSFLKRISSTYKMFDICMLSDIEMITMLNDARKEFVSERVIPIVAVGHSKNFNNSDNFETFIKLALEKGNKFTNFNNIIDQIV